MNQTLQTWINILKSDYLTVAGVFFHALAAVYIWIAAAYLFKSWDSFLVPVAGMLVSMDHITMIYKLYHKISLKTYVYNREEVSK